MKQQHRKLKKRQGLMMILSFSLSFFLFLGGCEKKDNDPNKVADDTTDVPAAIAKKMDHTITSSLMEDKPTFEVTVYLPVAFSNNNKLPVIYLLNDQIIANPNALQHIAAGQILDKSIAAIQSLNLDAIIVLLDTDEHPSRYWDPLGLEIQSFYDFFTNELIPFVDTNYENDNSQKIFLGHGSGGLLGMVFLLKEVMENPYFKNFILVDSYAWLTIRDRIEMDDFPQAKPNLKLYLSMSKTVNYDLTKPHYNLIQGKQYPWLSIMYEEKFDFDHNTIIEPSFSEGLKFAFDLD